MDAIDLNILESLQKNGRQKNSVLARTLNIPATTLQERIRRLEESGVIIGYRAVVDPKKIGYGVQAIIGVSLHRHESRSIREFERGIDRLPQIRACYHTSGRFDYLMHVVVKDLAHLGDLVKTGITALPDFGRCETFLIYSEINTEPYWPVEAEFIDNSKGKIMVNPNNKNETRGDYEKNDS